jgi:mannose-6-phosphate isomerase
MAEKDEMKQPDGRLSMLERKNLHIQGVSSRDDEPKGRKKAFAGCRLMALYHIIMKMLQFTPIYQERVWGGRGFEHSLGRELPAGQVIGESWEIVDRPEAQSLVAGGPFAGLTIRELILQHGKAVMGPNYDASKPFPILVKWLDCQDRLSLQVHPPLSVAGELGGEPKTENWYIAECKPGAGILAGLKKGATREAFEASLKDNSTEKLVQRIPVKVGDSMFVMSGRLHAIDAGNLILEIQQNSDTTYRVYDWGRVGLDGKPRKLHVEQSLKSIDFGDFEPKILHPRGNCSEQKLVKSDIFNLRRITIKHGKPLAIEAGEEPRILSIVEGCVTDTITGQSLAKGANALLPFDSAFSFNSDGDAATILLTEAFA